ncbi:MAG: tetratricopeptide repeat-containing sensor histidine kinase [Prevotellaceae bacterium]|nr:tetratricopeptide repeat-containing sensor histidine kinase [Candidatus Minthosoma caballi]
MIRNILILILFIIPLLSYGKKDAKAYDHQQVATADAAFSRVLKISSDELERGIAIGDSLMRVGEQQNNYMVCIIAYKIKMHMYQIADRFDDFKAATDSMMALALDNNNMVQYFTGYYKLCNVKMDYNSAEAVLMAQEMMKKAEELDYPQGVAWGYSLLGEVNLFYRDDFLEAAQKFDESIKIASKYPDCANLDMVRQYISLAKSYNESRHYDQAQAAVEKAYSISDDELDSLQIIVAELDIAYNKNVSAQEYDALHRRMLSNTYINTMIDEDTRLFYHIRWLIMTDRCPEALKLSYSLKIPKDQYLMRCDIYRKTRKFDAFVAMNDSLEAVRDSINHHLSEELMLAMDGQMRNIDLREEAARSRLIVTVTIIGSFVILLACAVIVLIYINRRRKENMMKMAHINRRLNKANEAKAHFIQSMTHELHTPLNAINGFAALLSTSEMEFDAESRSEMLKAISDSSMELTRLIDDIVLLNSYESSEEEPAKTDFTAEQVIIPAIQNVVQPRTDRVRLYYAINTPDGHLIHSNASMVQRLLEDLISNAVKFTDNGEICVSADIAANRSSITFAVTDTGIGIPPGKEEIIFQRFTKLDQFIPGTGLGLSLCRVISSKLGGQVTLDTTYRDGARFVFTIPLR